MWPIMQDQNVICSKTHLDSTTHKQTVICGQLFVGHGVGSWPMKRKTLSNDTNIDVFVCKKAFHEQC